jgi:hypothetical protein
MRAWLSCFIPHFSWRMCNRRPSPGRNKKNLSGVRGGRCNSSSCYSRDIWGILGNHPAALYC